METILFLNFPLDTDLIASVANDIPSIYLPSIYQYTTDETRDQLFDTVVIYANDLYSDPNRRRLFQFLLDRAAFRLKYGGKCVVMYGYDYIREFIPNMLIGDIIQIDPRYETYEIYDNNLVLINLNEFL